MAGHNRFPHRLINAQSPQLSLQMSSDHFSKQDIENENSSVANLSIFDSRTRPLVFVTTSSAIFSEASRSEARSHAATWSRRRSKEAKVKSKSNRPDQPAVDDGIAFQNSDLALPPVRLLHQMRRHNLNKTNEATVQSSKPLPKGRLNLPNSSCRYDADNQCRIRENLVLRRNLGNEIPPVCGRNGTIDPFNSLEVEIDSSTYGLIQFYKHAQPMAWDSQPYAPHHHDLDGDNGSIMNSCMSSRLHIYTFLYLSAALMETLSITEVTFPHATLYLQYSLTEIQKELRKKNKVDEPKLLNGVSTLSIAAAIQGDIIAARAHLRVAKYLVDRLGGFDALKPLIAQRIRYADFHLAIETLSTPVFALNFEPDGFPDQQCDPDPLSKQLREMALRNSTQRLSPCMSQFVQRLIQCVEVLEGVWANANSPSMKNVEWIASKIGATMNGLLSHKLPETTEPRVDKAQEATKVTLILWNLIILVFAKGVISDATLRSTMPVFRSSTLEAMRAQWPAWIYLGLMSWNEVVRSPSLGNDDRANLWSLLNVVRSMEPEGLVNLADLMDRLYQLEDIYQLQRKQPEYIAYV